MKNLWILALIIGAVVLYSKSGPSGGADINTAPLDSNPLPDNGNTSSNSGGGTSSNTSNGSSTSSPVIPINTTSANRVNVVLNTGNGTKPNVSVKPPDNAKFYIKQPSRKP